MFHTAEEQAVFGNDHPDIVDIATLFSTTLQVHEIATSDKTIKSTTNFVLKWVMLIR